jgi:hypothetical protein
VTVPQPNHPPVPPAPALPEAPQLNAYVNAFTPPPQPKPAAPTAASVPDWMQPNPAMQQQQQQQMMMQQQMMQQQMLQQQILMAQGYRPNPHMMNGYMPQGNPMPSPGPTNNGSRMYAGPMPPNTPFAAPMMPGYPPMVPMQPMQPMQPMMPQQPMQPNPAMQQVSYQQPPTPQQAMAQQVEQLVKVMRESPYPSQRETAAQSLTNFDWRVSPQIIPALVQGASQDPASSVRAGCVNCLCRMGAAVEPVLGTLHQMRNDTDPRVRQEVERALMAFGQMTPR